MDTFQATLLATLQILFMAGVGFFLVKRAILDDQGLDTLSNLLVKLFLPQMIFFHLTQHFDFKEYANWWAYPALSLAMVLSGWVVSRGILLFHPQCSNKNHFTALMSFANYGYFPLMLVASLFEGKMQHQLTVNIFLLIMGFDFAVWSLGVWLLTSEHDKKIYWSRLLNPPFITTICTLILIFLGGHRWIPQTVLKPVEMFSGCTLPLAMIVVGGNLAKTKLQLRRKADISLLIVGKLIVLPLLALAVVKIFHIGYSFGFLVVIEAAVPSAVSLSMMTRYFKVDSELVNQGIFWGSVMSVLTIPFVLTIYNFLAGPS